MKRPAEYGSGRIPEFTLPRAATSVVAISAAYVYFLIFAQFAFVKLAQADRLNQGGLRIVMACMGVAGVCASLAAARAFKAEPRIQRARLLIGFAGCGMAAMLALCAPGLLTRGLVAAMIGGFLGALTVNLAAGVPFSLRTRHRGLCVGLATGLAYAICNIPTVFGGTPRFQSFVAMAACATGFIASYFLIIDRTPDKGHLARVNGVSFRHRSDWTFACLVAIFLALVWLDSTAFNILQATPELNQFGWGSAELQWKNAGVHLVMAIVGGMLLDHGRLRRVLLIAFVALASAALCLSMSTPAVQMTHWLYAAGVSLYSAALVFAPTEDRRIGVSQAAMRAGILYAVAGWAGSAFGIGMAQDLHTVPHWFVGLAGGVVLLCSRQPAGSSPAFLLRRAIVIVGAGTLAFLVTSMSAVRRIAFTPRMTDSTAGREVYISEGCINCHTQYVRRGASDESWWGPAANPNRVLNQAPPLIGNRRSPAWNRLHLIDPSTLSPGSRMPSYAYLFAPDDRRGDALLAYLASLGADTFDRRTATSLNWRPVSDVKPIATAAQTLLFQRSCAQCHGPLGKGDGPLASNFTPVPPRDLTLGQWHFFAYHSASPILDLARTIKFGVAGTSMPGHEIFSDSEVLGLAQYVYSLKHSTNPNAVIP